VAWQVMQQKQLDVTITGIKESTVDVGVVYIEVPYI
jgi:hypothetical protein